LPPPISAEPAPEASDEQNRDAKEASVSPREAFLKLLAGMGVRYSPEKQHLEVDGWVNMQKGLIEVFACAPGGKTHESVVVLDCVPSALHAGLLVLGLNPGKPSDEGTEGDDKRPTGDGVIIEVRWKGSDDKAHTVRAEDWIWDGKNKRPMPHVDWVFTGSFMQPVPGNPEKFTYAANFIKSLVTTYQDATTILDNPLPSGGDDTVYYANENAVPPVNTPITVSFSPAKRKADD
jgi:hypothetical protein